MTSIFHAYDVRGIYPTELDETTAEKIGRAAALYLNAKKMVVGQDARTSSNSLTEAIIKGIRSTGCNVLFISQTTTPMFYFAVHSLSSDGGIMVTASHNPAGYNGFKIVRAEGMPVGEDSGLKEIEALMEATVPAGMPAGTLDREKVIDDYINLIIELSHADQEDFGRMRIVIDASNGMASLELKNLFRKINVNVIPLYWEIDERFPNHSPDVSQAKNLEELSRKVVQMKADIGVAFDGDGDRVAFVDNLGNIIWPDHILGLLYELLNKPKTVYDVRISHSIKELIGSNGVKSKVGYAHIKKAMAENSAGLAGELSGHFYFKELHYAESAVLVMLLILTMLNKSRHPISDLLAPLRVYAHSGEIDIPLAEGHDPARIFSMLKSKYQNGRLDETDGVTIEYDDWWFNLRASNTEPLIRLVVEADSQEMMEQRRRELEELIKNAAA